MRRSLDSYPIAIAAMWLGYAQASFGLARWLRRQRTRHQIQVSRTRPEFAFVVLCQCGQTTPFCRGDSSLAEGVVALVAACLRSKNDLYVFFNRFCVLSPG